MERPACVHAQHGTLPVWNLQHRTLQNRDWLAECPGQVSYRQVLRLRGGWSMTYDWSGRRMRRMRAAKLTIISLVAAFVLTAPIFAHY